MYMYIHTYINQSKPKLTIRVPNDKAKERERNAMKHSLPNLLDTKKQVHTTKEGFLNFETIDNLRWIICRGAVLRAEGRLTHSTC